jgi:hypothetical protein
MKVAFGTVVYKEAFDYYIDFIDSINNQTYRDFDTIILNDNLDTYELHKLSNSLRDEMILWNGKDNSKPFELRVELIRRAKQENYDLLILGDFDDKFSTDRVSKIVCELEEAFSFYYNDIYYFNKENKFFNQIPKHTLSISNILESNYLGLSNTALDLRKIDFKLIDELEECACSIFDWCMYSTILNHGLTGKRVEDCKTYYRIHSSNIAGINKCDHDSIHREINIKLEHYSILKDKNPEFTIRYNRYLRIENYIKSMNTNQILSYIENNDYWWGKIDSNNEKWREIYDIQL